MMMGPEGEHLCVRMQRILIDLLLKGYFALTLPSPPLPCLSVLASSFNQQQESDAPNITRRGIL